MNRAFQPLQKVNLDQTNQAFFTIQLTKYRLAIFELSIIFGLIVGALLHQHILERSKGAHVQALNDVVDFLERRKLVLGIKIRLDIDGFESFRELTDIFKIVVFLDVFSGTGNSQQIQNLEVAEIQAIDQLFHGAGFNWSFEPFIETGLGLLQGVGDVSNAMLLQGVVIPFGDKKNLVLQVVQAVVDRRGREHQHFGFDPGADDVIHHARVTSVSLSGDTGVAKVV